MLALSLFLFHFAYVLTYQSYVLFDSHITTCDISTLCHLYIYIYMLAMWDKVFIFESVCKQNFAEDVAWKRGLGCVRMIAT